MAALHHRCKQSCWCVTQVYLDVKVEGQSLGRIVIELSDNAPVAAQRFADLAEGKQGVGYRLSKFDGIYDVSGEHAPVQSRSYHGSNCHPGSTCQAVLRCPRLRQHSLPAVHQACRTADQPATSQQQ